MAETYNWENGMLLNAPVFPKNTVEYQSLLDSNDFSKLEDLLMERFETMSDDIAFFLPAYRLFVKKQETDRAAALLGLHVESLRARGDLTSEIVLLQAVLGFWPGCRYAARQLLDHLKTMYAQCANFGKYTRHLQISAETEGVEKLRELELWLRFDEGRVVYVPSRGVVRIEEANTKIGVVRMDFDSGEHMSLRLDEAERLAQPFTDSHFLARTIIDRDAIRQTAANDPGELLRLFFASVRREVGLSELREMLAGIVSEPEWNTWWTRVRKDPRLIVGAGTKPQLNWNDSIAEGSAGLMVTFLKAQTREKIDMLKKYAARSESMAMEMAQSLFSEAAEMLDNDPSFALEIVLTVDGLSQCKGVMRPFAAGDLLAGADAGSVIADIQDRLARKKAVQLVADVQEAWQSIFAGLFKTETDISILKLIYEALFNAGHHAILAGEVQRVFASPMIFPRCYLWLCKELPNRPELQNHANGEFVRTLLSLMDDSAFRGHHAVLRKLFDPGEAVDRAIETLDAPGGRSFIEALSRSRELEDHIKENVRLKLYSIFPELLETKQTQLLVSRESIDKKRIEFEKLVKVAIPTNAMEIQRNRENMDQRENIEYHEARRQQELLSSRAKTMHAELVSARPIEPRTVDTSKISIGTRVSLRPEDGVGEAVRLTILGPWDSDTTKNILSYTSAAAEALLNAKRGSMVTFNGTNYVVDEIDVWASY